MRGIAQWIAEHSQPVRLLKRVLNGKRARHCVRDRLPAIDVLIVKTVVEVGLRWRGRHVEPRRRETCQIGGSDLSCDRTKTGGVHLRATAAVQRTGQNIRLHSFKKSSVK